MGALGQPWEGTGSHCSPKRMCHVPVLGYLRDIPGPEALGP